MTPTLHADDLGLLRTILTHPGDDAPRLVYCDWLEEHAGNVRCGRCKGWNGSGLGKLIGAGPTGGALYEHCSACSGTGWVSNGLAERAEFVRVQIELARLGPPRKSYSRTAHFTFLGGKGSVIVYGEPVSVGDRMDLDISDAIRNGETSYRFKRKWHGLRVTDARITSARASETWVEFEQDGDSGPWPGQALRSSEEKFLLRRTSNRDYKATWSDWLPSIEDGYYLTTHGEQQNQQGIGVEFHRGFIRSVTCPGDQLTAVVAAICPDIERVCERCEKGRRKVRPLQAGCWLTEQCPTCRGQGFTRRDAEAHEQPVTEIVLTGGLPPYYNQTREGLRNDLDRRFPRRRFAVVLPGGQRIEPPAREAAHV